MPVVFCTACAAAQDTQGAAVSVENFYEDMDGELLPEPMVFCEPDGEDGRYAEDKVQRRYSYSDGVHRIELCDMEPVLPEDGAAVISIDGYEMEIMSRDYIASGTNPEIGFYDINNDGRDDVIIRRQQFRGWTAMILLSSGDEGYREIPSPSSLEPWEASGSCEYRAEYLDGYRIRVQSGQFGIDETLDLSELAVDWFKRAGWVYDENGKVLSERAAEGLTAGEEQEVRYFFKEKELYICLRCQFGEGSVWTGVSMSRVYKVTAGGVFEPTGMYLDEDGSCLGW